MGHRSIHLPLCSCATFVSFPDICSSSPGRLAESSPHTMHEDRVILESVFAKNRNAIIDLHNLSSSSSDKEQCPSTSRQGDHLRRLSQDTGVEIPPMADVLPAATCPEPPKSPYRRFSRRGARLAVHKAIIGMDVHDVPVQLKEKWIHSNRSHQAHRQSMSGGPPLTKISEVDSDKGGTLEEVSNKATEMPRQDSNVVESGEEKEIGRTPGHRGILSPMSDKIHKVMDCFEAAHSIGMGNLVPQSLRKGRKPALTKEDIEAEFERYGGDF